MMAESRNRSQRASAACDFCRRRKLGCDNAKPKCENCQTRDVACTYAKRIVQARPSNARIQKLEKENAGLREQLRLQSPASSDGTSLHITNDSQKALSVQPRSQSDTSTLTPVSLTYSPTTIGQSEESVFHGPTSGTTGEDTPEDSEKYVNSSTTLSTRNQLLAETTRQRQLEGVNLRSRKLDFRGVDSKIGMGLLSNFWNRQHCTGSIVYRSAFMRDMATNGPYFSDLLLHAMLFAGSAFTEEAAAARNLSEVNATGRQFRAKFEQILHSSGSHILFKSEITTVQALLVVSDALFSWCNERSLSWHYLGLAISMIVDLGLHVEGSARKSLRKRSAEDIEIERRVFWAAFTLDKVQSIYQGRPTRLREHDNTVPVVFLDEFEELEEFNSHTYAVHPAASGCPTYSISTFEQLCRLSIIMDRILNTLYAEQSSKMHPVELWNSASSLYGQLESWRENMPEHLQIDPNDPVGSAILPHTLSLMALYHSLIILVYRPFLSEGHLTTALETVALEAFSNCATAALDIHQILRIYKQNFCFKTSPYFISYATYVSATIHIRMAAQQTPSSQAHMCLRSCMEILNIQQRWSHGPKRTMRILNGLMQRLDVHVGDFVAMQPIHCHIDEPKEDSTVEASAAQQRSAEQVPGRLSFDESSSVETLNLPQDFQASGGWQLTDFDIDQIMNSFIFEPPLPLHQSSPITPQDMSQSSFSQCGMDDGQLASQDLMIFDDLFGFDSSVS